jgi:hypothetical protein
MHLAVQVPSLFANKGRVRDPETADNAFINSFLTITEKLDLYQIRAKDAILFLKDEFPVKFVIKNYSNH